MLGNVSDKDLRLLRVFVSVVESGGFSLATAHLNVAESTISTHITDLETRLGIRLCERGRSGFRVTTRGQEVYQETLVLFEQMDEYRERLGLLRTQLEGTLRIGMPDGLLAHDQLDISGWLRFVSDSQPSVNVELLMETPRVLERMLLDEKIHCAITAKHRSVAGLEFRLLANERNQFYCNNTHMLFSVPDECITVEMIEAAAPIARGYIERFDKDFFDPSAHRSVVHHIESAALLILSGRHVGFLPVHYAKPYVETGQLRALKPNKIFVDVPMGVVFKKGREQNLLISTVLKDLAAGRLTTQVGKPSA
ncbi:LysR family transcriptional regulator [Kiloniella spongiae]|uniref:LysR family transcriptional regulator n=1 Tax=Kiloniella spongiae TaxID=1489064 RepID=UPI00138E0E24|nr:LysR family transcriptional regulator [Kiloniella spongiae]